MKYSETRWTLKIGFFKSNEIANEYLSFKFIFVRYIAQ